MALLNQIGGISTGTLLGVADGPLSKLYNSNRLAHFHYPNDIGNDPSRMHYVLFEIKDIQALNFTSKQVNSLFDGSAIGGSAFNAVQSIKQNGFLSSVESAVGSLASSISHVLTQQQSFLQPATKRTKASIALYMPDTLAMNYNQDYSDLSLVDATNGMNRVAGGVGSIVQDIQNGIKNGKSMTNITSTIMTKYGAAYGTEYLSGAIDKAMGTSMQPLLLKKTGRAINPQLQLIYQGLGFRTFTMEFLFTPKTADEAAQVTGIVNTFVYASHPTIEGEAGMYFIPPSIFNIKFQMAKAGAFTDLSNTLEGVGNNLLSGLPIGNIGSQYLGQTGIGKKFGVNASVENDRLFKVADCVLESVSVDYAPNGWAAYNDGAPVQTRLTLGFKELTINDRNRFAGNIKGEQQVR